MDEKKLIIEDFANDFPFLTITDIEPLSDMGDHYYNVKGNDENGEFETSVFVDNELVLILPE